MTKLNSPTPFGLENSYIAPATTCINIKFEMSVMSSYSPGGSSVWYGFEDADEDDPFA